jgi:hypothetical protein
VLLVLEHRSGYARASRSRVMKQVAAVGANKEMEEMDDCTAAARTTAKTAAIEPPPELAPYTFTAALAAVPAEDWCRTWAAGRTIMLRMTSKRVKELVDKMRPPAVVCLNALFFWFRTPSTDDLYGHTMRAHEALGGSAVQRFLHVILKSILSVVTVYSRITRALTCKNFWQGGLLLRAEKLKFVLNQLTALTASCCITKLKLPCRLKSQDTATLAGVLLQCQALAHLNLCDNDIGAAGAESLAGALGQCPALAHLNLSRDVQGARNAVEDLSRDGIGAEGAESLARVLGQCTALAHLNLRENRIGLAGAESLAGVLGHCASLAHLDLSLTQIGPDGAASLAKVLGQCRALTHLDLSCNQIESAGAESLARVLGQCAALAHLNLSSNDLKEAGAESLARVLGQCAALTHLNLSSNDLKEAGAESLARVLGHCAALAHLSLCGNGLRGAGAERLRSSWRGQDSGLSL